MKEVEPIKSIQETYKYKSFDAKTNPTLAFLEGLKYQKTFDT